MGQNQVPFIERCPYVLIVYGRTKCPIYIERCPFFLVLLIFKALVPVIISYLFVLFLTQSVQY